MAAACVTISLTHPAIAEIPAVQHVVIVFQENRTPDNLFHNLRNFLPKADIAETGINSKGETIELKPSPLAGTYDLNHGHSGFVKMYDGGKMDGADLIKCYPQAGTKCPLNPQFRYVSQGDVAPYYFIATHYSFANRMFQSNQGPSFPAHQYILGGTSALSTGSPYLVAENPRGVHSTVGCTSPSNLRITTIGPAGETGTSAYPCFERQTLADLLNRPQPGARTGLTWRYYAPKAAYIWTAPAAIRHMCRPGGKPLHCTGVDYLRGNIATGRAQILTDIKNSNLASVSWVIPGGRESDHANLNDGAGPSWVAAVINAIGRSAYWNNTVILVTWDDWGGWYDHVKPPIGPINPFYESGFRVPLMVVSPYTPEGYVSEKIHNFGSILRFIETAYGLPFIPPGTYDDSRADDLSDFFDFTAPPRRFVEVPAPISADHFLNDRRPIRDPDDD
jgi:phospholipase C